ncbi:MAG: sugar ABC transporter ATP-binding protein [Planctomycetota bacterium]
MPDAASSREHSGAPLLEARGVSKRFGAVRALDEVSCTVRSGEVLAVVGENGAGKSTLMKILAGVHEPDAGEIRFEGRTVRMRSVRHAQDRGIALVHQELNLAENLDVAANIVLGREPRRLGVLDGRGAERIATAALEKVGLAIPPRTPVASLGVGARQLVEIAKSLAAEARVLILDEPTASLSKAEADRLIGLVSQLRERGTAVVLISHRLDEVLRMADRIVVLRDGRQRGELDRANATREKIVSLMVGRDVATVERREIETGAVRLAVKGVCSEIHPRHAVDLEVRGGEVVGLAGLVGSGRTELLETIFGVRRARAGVVEIEGVGLPSGDPRTAVARGVALVPEDRGRHGLFLPDPVRLNFAMATLSEHARGGMLSFQAIRRLADRLARDLHLRPPDHGRAAGTLSGGNQQKVVLGRWIALAPKVLLLDEPTRGVDVGARAEIHTIVRDLAAKGCAVLFASSELDEVLSLADRIVCLREGEVTGELAAAEASEEAVMSRLVAERAA